MADSQFFYLITQDQEHKVNVLRMSGVHKIETATQKAFTQVPPKTKAFMVMEETQLQTFGETIKIITRHLIGEK